MQQSVLHRLIGRHAQCQATMGTYQTAGTLDELAPQRTESEKVPQGRAFLQGQAGGGMGNHLQFPRQVVGQQHAQQVDLVPDPGARGDITHLIVGFQFGEQAFLSATTLMEHKHFACAQVLVGQDDFKLVAVLVRGEQIEAVWVLCAVVELQCAQTENADAVPSSWVSMPARSKHTARSAGTSGYGLP